MHLFSIHLLQKPKPICRMNFEIPPGLSLILFPRKPLPPHLVLQNRDHIGPPTQLTVPSSPWPSLVGSPRGVSPRLEWGHARAISSQGVAAVSHFLRVDQGICGFSSRLSQEAFPRGFPTRLSHRAVPLPPWCESILGLKVETVQGKQVSLEWTETSGGLWEWWHDSGVPLAFPVESAYC